MRPDIKKNLLDLSFQKQLVIASTAIILGFTYIVGFGVALVTNQIDLKSNVTLALLIIITILLYGILSIFFLKARKNMEFIVKDIKTLE